MASSNRHWPSMFKSKHCNAHHLQWHNEVNPSGLLSGSCHRTEERAPEPKPRWNPKPEQIRILEAIFNSGMVNPPRDEIRRIRAQLQEYGQVGDANVFYWFQNRKSRSKHKLRHLQSQRQQQRTTSATQTSLPVPTSSSSSSSTERSGNSKPTSGVAATPTLAVATTGQGTSELVAYLSSLMEAGGAQWGGMVSGEGHCKSTTTGGEEEKVVDQLPTSVYDTCTVTGEGLAVVTTSPATVAPTPIPNSIIGATTQGDEEEAVVGEGRDVATPARSLLIFINDVAFEIGADHLNVRAAFGETAMLLHSSGQPVLLDQWGITLHPLEHGASYYLV